MNEPSVQIYNESCLETLRRMESGSVNAVITSPPYNLRLRVHSNRYATYGKKDRTNRKYSHFADDIPIEDYYLFHAEVIRNLLRVSRTLLYNFQLASGNKEAFFRIIGEFGRYIKDIIIWDKGWGEPAMSAQVLNSCYEFIVVMESDGRLGRKIRSSKFGRGTMPNVIRVKRTSRNVHGHLATFPQVLAEKLIEAFSSNGETIYDPFMGTGTTGLAAIKLGRNFIGSEVVAEYCEQALKSFSVITKKLF